MSVYTCITCRVAFADAELQRTHYKSDWHRYNLKRKVAEMTPVTAENFKQRVLAQKEEQENKERDTGRTCQVCQKHFSTENAFENHVGSKKHKEVAAKQESGQTKRRKGRKVHSQKSEDGVTPADGDSNVVPADGDSNVVPADGDSNVIQADDEASDEEWEANQLGIEECLFCSHISGSLEDNMSHMTLKHSFFIPDIEYMVDLEGLIIYLGEKVGIGHLCLWCDEKGKSFQSRHAAQRHMLDKCHCKLLHEGDVVYEYADYYDYRSSYPEGEGQATGGTDDDDSDDVVEPDVIVSDGYELVLPSGVTIGHRSLAYYYKQTPRPDRNLNQSLMPRVRAQYKALGWGGPTGVVAQKRIKDLRFMQRLKQRHFMRLGCKANIMQHHYREQNPK